MKITKIDIDADAFRILTDVKQKIRETDPDRKVNYSAAIRELAKEIIILRKELNEWKKKQ